MYFKKAQLIIQAIKIYVFTDPKHKDMVLEILRELFAEDEDFDEKLESFLEYFVKTFVHHQFTVGNLTIKA